ncbi:tetraacyldisaccharide 4'-kinase [Vibrio sp. SCSIO 43140]|uniref:tetraacyldisaccharide 4'-kinase n=1 Tax=Vibrio sp. SCSIO 43140 TaxID=2819100 RepID=UPI002075487A|nr:tetraacyldisaccharide 4'-kinase [Vibrio sp. SCSIO 43140]USD59379.1 tetraacyldisaccharide 4'-kinase [Vibrio sp. SCSIO 43140]
MIDKLWFGNHPLRFILWPLLWPLSQLYLLVSTRRRRAYESGSKPRYKAKVPVIVVGNITAGGNGKTPMVVWLVEHLVRQGKRPGVVSRGYGGKAAHYPLMVSAETLPSECGDEPKLIFERTQVPVCVDPVRVNATKQLESLGVDVIITDDGLQHYALDRAFEIIVIDGVRRFGNQQAIPLGPMRESLSRLDEVDLKVVNGGPNSQQLQINSEKRFVLCPDTAVNLVTGKTASISELGSLAAFAGIGHPPRFFDTLEKLGASLAKTQGFADHQAFDAQKLAELSVGVDNVIMTEKDAVKCRSFSKDNWWYLPVSAQFTEQDSQQILLEINKVIESYGSQTA